MTLFKKKKNTSRKKIEKIVFCKISKIFSGLRIPTISLTGEIYNEYGITSSSPQWMRDAEREF